MPTPRKVETWSELSRTGRQVRTTRLDFESIPAQLQYLRQMIDVYRGTTWAREHALEILREKNTPDRNKAAMAVDIAEAVQERVAYINERPERFQTPPNTWETRAGDCDDHTTLIGTLLEAVGIPVQVVGMKVDGSWKHVFPRALIQIPGGKSLPMPLDTTLRDTPVRRMVNPILRAREKGMRVETMVF